MRAAHRLVPILSDQEPAIPKSAGFAGIIAHEEDCPVNCAISPGHYPVVFRNNVTFTVFMHAEIVLSLSSA